MSSVLSVCAPVAIDVTPATPAKAASAVRMPAAASGEPPWAKTPAAAPAPALAISAHAPPMNRPSGLGMAVALDTVLSV